jgi:hypothetical protein
LAGIEMDSAKHSAMIPEFLCTKSLIFLKKLLWGNEEYESGDVAGYG